MCVSSVHPHTLFPTLRLDVMSVPVEPISFENIKHTCSVWNFGNTHTFSWLLAWSTWSTGSGIMSNLEVGQSVVVRWLLRLITTLRPCPDASWTYMSADLFCKLKKKKKISYATAIKKEALNHRYITLGKAAARGMFPITYFVIYILCDLLRHARHYRISCQMNAKIRANQIVVSC